MYGGGIPEYPRRFALDDHHVFVANKPMPICGNTAAMLQETRFAEYFQVIGDRSVHYGPFSSAAPSAGGAGPCC